MARDRGAAETGDVGGDAEWYPGGAEVGDQAGGARNRALSLQKSPIDVEQQAADTSHAAHCPAHSSPRCANHGEKGAAQDFMRQERRSSVPDRGTAGIMPRSVQKKIVD